METVVKYHRWKGLSIAKDMLSSYDKDILVYFDPDVDGMVAGYLVCKYLSLEGKSFRWYVNSGRKHDWSIEFEKLKGINIVAVDFMIPSNTVEDVVNAGANLVSMDHHVNQGTFIDYSYNTKRGIVINNQYPFEDEDGRYLSGAGVVFETLRLLNPKMDTKENRALVGLTLLSDVCNIENPIARGYLKDLYEHKMKGYIRYLIEHTIGPVDYGFGVPRLDRKYVDYIFSPAINSALRFGAEDEVVEFFLGSGELDLGYHKRQKELIKKMFEVAHVVEMSNLIVVYVKDYEVPTEENIEHLSNFIGLLASRYLDGSRSVISYLISNDDEGNPFVKRASFRGNINGVDYLSRLNDVLVGVGHPSAFGVVEIQPSKKLFKVINRLCIESEGSDENVKLIQSTSNLSLFNKKHGYAFGEYNMYCLAQHSRFVRYNGKSIKTIKSTPTHCKYKVDGVDVISFDDKLTFDNALIYPILERGYLYYYLQGN